MSTNRNIMREKHVTFSECPTLTTTTVVNNIHDNEKRQSIAKLDKPPSSNINVKLEKYRNLLAKEYQLRFKMERAKSDLELRKSCCMHCQKQKEMETSRISHSSISKERKLTKTHKFEEHKHLENESMRKGRPLSADSLHIPLSAMLRKEEAKLKAEHRRASIQSLEEDFKKYQTVLSKARALSIEECQSKSLDSVKEETRSPMNQLKRNSITKRRPSSSFL